MARDVSAHYVASQPTGDRLIDRLFDGMRQEVAANLCTPDEMAREGFKPAVPQSLVSWLLGRYDGLGVEEPITPYDGGALDPESVRMVYAAMATGELTGQPIDSSTVFLYASARAIQLAEAGHVAAEVEYGGESGWGQENRQAVQTEMFHYIRDLYHDLGLPFQEPRQATVD